MRDSTVMLEPQRLNLAKTALEYIHENFAPLAARIPEGMAWFPGGFSRVDGVCSHPHGVKESWLRFSADFTTATVPDDFTLVGVKNAGGSEYLLAMWRRGERTFWFRKRYVIFVADMPGLMESARTALADALTKWDGGAVRVEVRP